MVTKENILFFIVKLNECKQSTEYIVKERLNQPDLNCTKNLTFVTIFIFRNYQTLILEANCFILECWDNTQNIRKDLTIYNSKKTLLKTA